MSCFCLFVLDEEATAIPKHMVHNKPTQLRLLHLHASLILGMHLLHHILVVLVSTVVIPHSPRPNRTLTSFGSQATQGTHLHCGSGVGSSSPSVTMVGLGRCASLQGIPGVQGGEGTSTPHLHVSGYLPPPRTYVLIHSAVVTLAEALGGSAAWHTALAIQSAMEMRLDETTHRNESLPTLSPHTWSHMIEKRRRKRMHD